MTSQITKKRKKLVCGKDCDICPAEFSCIKSALLDGAEFPTDG